MENFLESFSDYMNFINEHTNLIKLIFALFADVVALIAINLPVYKKKVSATDRRKATAILVFVGAGICLPMVAIELLKAFGRRSIKLEAVVMIVLGFVSAAWGFSSFIRSKAFRTSELDEEIDGRIVEIIQTTNSTRLKISYLNPYTKKDEAVEILPPVKLGKHYKVGDEYTLSFSRDEKKAYDKVNLKANKRLDIFYVVFGITAVVAAVAMVING